MKTEIKLWQPIIGFFLTIVISKLNDAYLFYLPGPLWEILYEIIPFIYVICILMFIYVIIRNIFRAIKGAVTGAPQGSDYRGEARRACEKVTPKRKQNTTPPWEG